MARGYFFVGTDHKVGTTTLSGAIAGLLRKLGKNTGVFNPVNTNAKFIEDTKTTRSAEFLKQISNCQDEIELINPYAFELPYVPYVAATFEGDIEISVEKLDDIYFRLSLLHDSIFIDGGAGLLTPLTRDETMVDLLLMYSAELVIVTSPSPLMVSNVLQIGYFALQTGIPILGLIVNGWYDEAATIMDFEQLEAISNHIDIPIIGLLPWFEHRDFSKLENHQKLMKEIQNRFDIDIFSEKNEDWHT